MNRVEKQSHEDLSVPISRERRKLLSGIAASCAAIASTAIGHSSASAVSEAAPQVGQRESQAPCERRKVVASDRVTVVETSAGKVRGFERSGVFIFKGVPYGASTSGANRFMPPMKPESWAGIRNALAYGRICPQEDSAHSNTDGKNLANADEDAFLLHRGYAIRVPGEDCLRVNVWTPEINGSGKRPVMVYMHGGGFSGGCGHDLLSYEGESLARNHDVVLVNHNHRLNVYGYLNLEGLFGDEFASSANVGMLDLVAVLEQASRKAALGVAPAYSYIYSWRTPVLDNRPGTFHACEISFAFDNAEICDHYSAGDSAAFVLSKQMSAAWVSFARTGNPNHSGLPPWPRYTQESRAVMYFDTPCAPRNNPEGKGLDIIVRSQPS